MSQKNRNQDKRPNDYYYLETIQRAKIQLKKLLIPSEYKLIEKYDIVMLNEALADATRCKQIETILSLTRILSKKSWMALTRDDIDILVSNVMRTYSNDGKETNTTYDHKKILKIWFRWIKLDSRSFREVGNPPELKNIKQKQVADKIVREELVTPEDVTNLMSACTNLRDKALLHVQYEAGTRPGELLSLKIKHVKVDKYGMKIAVDGKTGARPIRLIESVPTLSKWIATHPFKDDPESWLWINFYKNSYGDRLTHASATRILYKACKNAKINKKINLKLFRHSEATRTATFMPEATLRKRHGWAATSKMPAKYAHINQQDVEDAILGHYGIIQENTVEKRIPQICPICKNLNSFDADLCDNCSRPLSIEKAIEIEESEKQVAETQSKEIKSLQEQMGKVLESEQRTQDILQGMITKQSQDNADMKDVKKLDEQTFEKENLTKDAEVLKAVQRLLDKGLL